jgi:uncharacterized damage-inducible protein DinB
MSDPVSNARLDIVPMWTRLNEQLIRLVEQIPEEHLDWSPRSEMWSFRRLFGHMAEAREQWMTRAINDGAPNYVGQRVLSKDEIRDALRETWERIERTFADQAKLDAAYKDQWWDKAPMYNGHWVAFHLLEHDIHHRADMVVYAELLGLDLGSDFTQTM